MAFRRKGAVQLGPVIHRAANGGGIDLAEQRLDVAGLHPFEKIIGTREVSRTFDSHPLPT